VSIQEAASGNTTAAVRRAGVGMMFIGSFLLATAACVALQPAMGIPIHIPYLTLTAIFIDIVVGLPIFVGGCIKFAKN
jgi:hypothetical protein